MKSCPIRVPRQLVDTFRSLRKKKQESCPIRVPRQLADTFRSLKEEEESCPICVPRQLVDTLCRAESEEIEKLSEMCPRTHTFSGHICPRTHLGHRRKEEKEKLSEMCPRTHLGHICEDRKEEEKLSEMCPRTHLGHKKKRRKEKLSEMCPRTHSGHICKIQEEMDKKLSESCPRTTKDHIVENDENTQICNRTQMSNEKNDSNCENIHTEKKKSTNCDQNAELSTVVDVSNQKYVPLSTNLWLKQKRRMLYFPMDFGELTIDGLIDTGALSSAIPESDLKKIRLLTPKSIIEEAGPPNFHIIVANGGVEQPIGQVLLQFEVGDLEFQERFIVMKNLTNPLIGLTFLQRNNTVLDVRQAVLNFPLFSMHLETTDQPTPDTQKPLILKSDLFLNPNEITTVKIMIDGATEHDTTGTVCPAEMYDDHDTVLICPALTTMTDRCVSLTISNMSSLAI